MKTVQSDATSEAKSATASLSGAMARIAIVVVNWNGWRDTLKAFESLLTSDFQAWTLIIVDNASSDDSVDRLRELGPKVHLIESRQNLGFAGGCNRAVAAARSLHLDYVFFLNNDATVTPETLGQLMAASRGLEDSAVLGPIVRFRETGDLQFLGGAQTKRSGAPEWSPGSEDYLVGLPDLVPSAFIFGAALFAPMAILDRVGPFDERFFLNFEETDWCYRARRNGFPCFVVKRALAYHAGGASLGSFQGPMQVYFMRRNELLFYEKHASFGQMVRLYGETLNHAQGRLRRALGLSRSPRTGFDPVTKALFLAWRDYAFRRFGDCPPVVRRLASELRHARQTPATTAQSEFH